MDHNQSELIKARLVNNTHSRSRKTRGEGGGRERDQKTIGDSITSWTG